MLASLLAVLISTASASDTTVSIGTLLSLGDCGDALESAGTASKHPTGIRIALAQCHLNQGDAASALDTLGSPAGGPLAGYAAAIEGAAWLDLGQPIDSVQALQSALNDPRLLNPVRSRAQLWLGRALIGIDDPQGASEVLSGLLGGTLSASGRLPEPGGVDPGEVRWWLAEAAVRRGEPESARAIWRDMWTRNPTSPFTESAAEKLTNAGGRVPDPGTAAGRTLIHQRIRTLEKLFRFADALALRERLPSGDAMVSARAMANAVFKAKDYPRAARLYTALGAPSPDEQVRLALARVRSGDYSGSNAVYRAMTVPGHANAELATWKLGYMAYDAGELARADTELQVYLDRYPSGKYADAALWYKAMAFIRRGESARAIKPLEALSTQHGGSSLIPGAHYWLARTADISGDAATAEEGYREVLRRWPVSGYAWFAAHRLGQSWQPKPIAQPPTVPTALETESWVIGSALKDAGLLSWARPHLQRLVTPAKRAGRDGALALAGSYREAIQLARPYCTKPWKGGDPVAMQACHPGPPHIPLSTPSGIPRNLPFAIMNAESGLRPEVTSPAGARGLMQLMPALAGDLYAQRYGADHTLDPDHLYKPLINASLGTDELGNLAATFEQAGVDPGVVLVIGGYNGGADAVQRWLKSWPSPPDADLYTENIGYTETRRYVRRVLGYLQAYRYVYGD